MPTLPEADALADLIAEGLFSDDAAARKSARAALTSHGNPKVSAFFAGDKRSYHSLADGAKIFKVLQEFDALGVHGARVALTLLGSIVRQTRSDVVASRCQPVLDAAMRYPGHEEAAFEALATVHEVYLTKVKKWVPRGLSRLRALRRLRIADGTLTSTANLDELARVPQRMHLDLWVKDVNLALWSGVAENFSGLELRRQYSNLTDLTALAAWKNLTDLDVEATQVTDVSPLRSMALTRLILSETRVADLAPLTAMKGLRHLGLRRTAVSDFSPLAAFTALERLDLGFSSLRDLTPLRGLRSLRELELWGTPVASLEPLVGLPLEAVNLNHVALPDLAPLARIPTLRRVSLVGGHDAPGLSELQGARPDVYVNR